MTGLIIKTTGADYLVRSEQGDFTCKIKGNFRIKGIKATNPITVGDRVEFDPESDYIWSIQRVRSSACVPMSISGPPPCAYSSRKTPQVGTALRRMAVALA